ncbi:MAG: recN [Oscillospiraceae bacterium]|jgi:DNA repair protein RecN (Recombination protein N)|nr:recN [Oscillospiraceae bacterium]
MLSQLWIQNIAVIQSAQIAFEGGLNVFTGETGAGKSILIGAIGAVLGSRTSKELIRTGEKKASVTALFTKLSETVCQSLEALGIDIEENELLIEREITSDSTVCRINGKLSNVAMLKNIGALMIHTHGQQDSQLLSLPETHLKFVDSYGELQPVIEDYQRHYAELCTIENKLAAIETDDAAKARQIDLLNYEIDEITACRLVDGEEEELLSRRRVIRNAEHLSELLYRCRQNLSGAEEFQGAIALLSDAAQALGDAGKYLDDLNQAAQTISSFEYELEDISSQLREQLDALEFDPRELDDIEERLDAISRLKKKYGSSISEILAYCEKAQQQLDEITLSEQTIQKLKAAQEKARKDAQAAADNLTQARRAAANGLISAVKAELRDLDMPAVQMDIAMTQKRLSDSGADEAEFLLSVNPGEALKPLSKIASGGEMSRIMLGIKNVLSGREDIGTLIFDEIDTGISGRAAQKVGAKLQAVANSRQVICVTHLAQVAAFGEHHLLIEKQVSEGRTFTQIQALDEAGRAKELARIMNGEPITELALENALQLLKNSRRSAMA